MRLIRFQQLRRGKFVSEDEFIDALREPMEGCRGQEAVKAVTAETSREAARSGQPEPQPESQLRELRPQPGSWLPVEVSSGGLVRKLVLRAVWRLLLRPSRLTKEGSSLKTAASWP